MWANRTRNERRWARIPTPSGHLGRDDSGISHFSDYAYQDSGHVLELPTIRWAWA